MTGGSLLNPTGEGGHAALLIEGNRFEGLGGYSYIWYPEGEARIERNVFDRCGGLNIGASNNVYVTNNVFHGMTTGYAVRNWALYGGSCNVSKNSFYDAGTVLELPKGYTNARMVAAGNFWNTGNESYIRGRIYDANTDLSLTETIEYSPWLDSPDPDTPAVTHAYGEWAVTKRATCTEAGSRERVCAGCGDKQTEKIDATGHSWPEEHTVDRPATCTEEGSESIRCSACGGQKPGSARAIARLAHAYGEWAVTKQATCTEAGSRERVCADCGDKATEAIGATGHQWAGEYTVDRPATCAEEGSESIRCTACGGQKPDSSRAIAALGHSFTKYSPDGNATCEADGTKSASCDRGCGTADTITDEGSALGHDWDEGVVTKEPTTTEEGVRTYTCKRDASHTRTEAIPVLSATQEMYRLYNPNSGEHFYTASAGERDDVKAAGWIYEGVGWVAPAESETPVYRLYNANGGEHHYTTDKGECDGLVAAGWNYEGVGWYSDDAEGVPLYRQYNPNQFSCNHNYTTDKAENDFLVSIGWKYEGIGWYGVD